jgi:hypothetical protein
MSSFHLFFPPYGQPTTVISDETAVDAAIIPTFLPAQPPPFHTALLSTVAPTCFTPFSTTVEGTVYAACQSSLGAALVAAIGPAGRMSHVFSYATGDNVKQTVTMQLLLLLLYSR